MMELLLLDHVKYVAHQWLQAKAALLGQAKLIHNLSLEIFENHMQAGGHYSYFMS